MTSFITCPDCGQTYDSSETHTHFYPNPPSGGTNVQRPMSISIEQERVERVLSEIEKIREKLNE